MSDWDRRDEGSSGCGPAGKVRELTVCFVVCGVICCLLSVPGSGSSRISRINKDRAPNRESTEGGTQEAAAIETKRLMLYPARPLGSGRKVSLLIPAGEMTDGDAVALFEKAVRLMPSDFDRRRVEELLAHPVQELPMAQVKSMLQRFEPALRLLSEGAKCKSCGQPWSPEDEASGDLTKFRNLIFLLELKGRHQLARGDYEGAMQTLQMGFALGRHMAEGPTLVHGLVGVAVCARMCREVETFIQQRNAPSLLAALEGLGRPLIDLSEKIESEAGDQHEEVRERIVGLQVRLDRHVAALRCIEALRLHMSKGGDFPGGLDEVAGLTNLTDPVTGKPFIYRRAGDKATVEGPIPENGRAKEAISYELVQAAGK